MVVAGTPPVDGLGTLGGFKLQVEDRANVGYPALQAATFQLIGAAMAQTNKITQALSTFRASVPQVFLDVDRAKAESMHVPLNAVWDTLQSISARSTSTTSRFLAGPTASPRKPTRRFGPSRRT